MAWRCSEPVMSYDPSAAITDMKGPVEVLPVEVMKRVGTFESSPQPLAVLECPSFESQSK